MNGKSGNLVCSLANGRTAKPDIERRLAEIALGVISAIEQSKMTVAQAWDEIFNLENYNEIRKRRLHRELIEMFVWGMELESVEAIDPSAVEDSLAEMTRLAHRILRRSFQSHQKRSSTPQRRRKIA